MASFRVAQQLCRLPGMWGQGSKHLSGACPPPQVFGLHISLVKRAHQQANYLIMIRRHFSRAGRSAGSLRQKESTWLVSRASVWTKSGEGVKDTKDSELKAKVEATVRSPAGADEQFYDRNFVTAIRAMTDFLLKPEHLVRQLLAFSL